MIEFQPLYSKADFLFLNDFKKNTTNLLQIKKRAFYFMQKGSFLYPTPP